MPVSERGWGSGSAVPEKEVMGFSKTGGALEGGRGNKGEEGAGKAEHLRKQI